MRFLLVVFFIFNTMSAVRAQLIDVVIDLDWTLFYPLDDATYSDPARTFTFEGQRYRLADHAEEVLAGISRKDGVRISFYSGGSVERNAFLLKQVMVSENATAFDLAYKVLNRNDLVQVSDDESLPFNKRNKKDLSKVQPNLKRVALFDDTPEFALDHQKKNQIWLGKTYNFYEKFEDVPSQSTAFDPPTLKEWRRERSKMLAIYEAVNELHANRLSNNPLEKMRLHLPLELSRCNLNFY